MYVIIRHLGDIMELICNRHGISNHRLSGKRWKCKKCDYLYTRKYLQNLKLKAIKYGGGECEICGYDKCWRALNFHHIDPSKKEFNIFASRPEHKIVRNWEKLKKEIDKCMLVCANCHTEIHSNDEKISYEEVNLNLDKTEIGSYNMLIIKYDLDPHVLFEKILNKD